MKDTTDKAEKVFRTMLMQRSGEERMRMGFGMFQFARSLVRAAVQDQHKKRPGIATISRAAETAEVFRRTYRSDFDAETLQRIAHHLAVRPDQ
jgi:hypothetical protein